jgi:hypothetical protein
MRTEELRVTVNVGGQEFARVVDLDVLESIDDVQLALTNGKAEEIIDNINSSVKSRLQLKTRNSIQNNEAKAALAEEESIENFMNVRKEAKMPVTRDQARKLLEMMKTLQV